MTRLRSGEHGVTLIELLVAIAIMGTVMAPLTASFVLGLQTTATSSSRVAGSLDAQLVSTYLPADVQSTGNAPGDVATSGTECSGAPNVLRLSWRATETVGTVTSYAAAYAVVGGPAASKLLRFYCINGVLHDTHTLARNLASSSPVTVTASGSNVSIQVTEVKAAREAAAYRFTVSGQRRTP